MKKQKIIVGLIAMAAAISLASCSGSGGSSSTSGASTTITTIEKPTSQISEEEAKAIQDAQAVTDLVNALTDTSTDEEILAAYSAYNALSELAKSKISEETYAKLMEKVEYLRQKQQQKLIQDVIDAIDSLSDASTDAEVMAVKDLYDDLDDSLKQYVTNVSKLDAQVKRVKERKAREVDELIKNAPTEFSKSTYFADYYKVEYVINRYDELSAADKEIVTEKDKLGELQKLYNSVAKYFDASEVVYSAWDYGADALKNVTTEEDVNYGPINKASLVSDTCTEFSLKTDITSASYVDKEKMIIAIYNPTELDLNCYVHGGYGPNGWTAGGQHTLSSKKWTNISFGKNVFTSGNEDEIGHIYLVLNGGLIQGDWLISSVLDYNPVCEHENLKYHRGSFTNGKGTVEYYECEDCFECWADEKKEVYLGNTLKDRSKIDITSEAALYVNWDKQYSVPVYDETDGYYFRNELVSKEKDAFNPIETTDSKFKFADKGYSTCTFSLTNNTSSELKIDRHSRAWTDRYQTINVKVGETVEIIISSSEWDKENSHDDYGFSLLCYNVAEQTGGFIQISKLIFK